MPKLRWKRTAKNIQLASLVQTFCESTVDRFMRDCHCTSGCGREGFRFVESYKQQAERSGRTKDFGL